MSSLRSDSSRRLSALSRDLESPVIGLRINPQRARTPRSFSVTSPTSDVDLEFNDRAESKVDQIEGNYVGDAENTPLIKRSSSSTGSKEHSDLGKLSFSRTASTETRESSLSTRLRESLEIICHWTSSQDRKKFFVTAKVAVLWAITALCCGVIMLASEESEASQMAVLTEQETVILSSEPIDDTLTNIRLSLSGPFYDTKKTNISGPSLVLRFSDSLVNHTVNETAARLGDHITITEDLECNPQEGDTHCTLTAVSAQTVPVSWHVTRLSWQLKNEVIYAFLILAFVYILIIFELVHRTLAALLGSLAALAVLSALNERPTLDKIVSWMDMETLTLLFGMMILVAIFSETGFFDYSALKAYKLAKGKIWPLVTLLCLFSAFVSALLDNVTTILLMAPVSIRLCEVLNLEPRRILIAEVLFSNIGGTATAIGDPPNVIIVGALSNMGITFSTFTMHMAPGILLICFLGYGMLRLYYRNMNELKNKDPPDIAEMKQEVSMWRRAASRIPDVTREETLMKALFLQKAVEIEHVMNKTIHRMRREEQKDMKVTLRKLERQYYIKNIGLLVKSGAVLLVVVLFLFIYSFIDQIHLGIGWIAVLGALWLLVLADNDDMEGILHKVEWSTLLFFAALFVLMEALGELGMIKTIGDVIADIIKSVDHEHRLLLAIIVILWVSALASSFIDNIPYTTAMVPVLQQISENPDIDLPMLPLVIALAFGACLGGNGTLIGASCNVVCAGIAEQHGYGFSFVEFFKIGFPMMLLTTVGATVYLLLCHVAMDWNYV